MRGKNDIMTLERRMDNNISRIILSKGISQTELAKKVGVKREYMNRIIHRKIIPTIPLGMKIARALDKIVEEVFY